MKLNMKLMNLNENENPNKANCVHKIIFNTSHCRDPSNWRIHKI